MFEEILGIGSNMPNKLLTTKFKTKQSVREFIQDERQKIMQTRREKIERTKYLENQLSLNNELRRNYSDVYSELYDYSQIMIENSLKPLKEYYYNNPQDFDINDPTLMDKAYLYAEKVKRKADKFKLINEHDKQL